MWLAVMYLSLPLSLHFASFPHLLPFRSRSLSSINSFFYLLEYASLSTPPPRSYYVYNQIVATRWAEAMNRPLQKWGSCWEIVPNSLTSWTWQCTVHMSGSLQDGILNSHRSPWTIPSCYRPFTRGFLHHSFLHQAHNPAFPTRKSLLSPQLQVGCADEMDLWVVGRGKGNKSPGVAEGGLPTFPSFYSIEWNLGFYDMVPLNP
ncbi:hypothetical protein F4775DRAFT_532316 [Biscogniauxia sp. FL1348]|nr:hypothetical protein F4775DRAFT_532316 [Biscogniauxia sp. FL1348]